MVFDHVAIAVRSVEAAADRFCGLLGYTRKTIKVTNTRQKVNVLFLARPGSLDIKLIEPSEPESPLWDFVKKGGGLHHLAFKTGDVQAGCEEMMRRGARVTARPEPGEAFDDHLIAFLYLGMGLSVELIDTDSRRGLITGSAE
jgi:methylmalonyl-CoA/ethylmalonyl-CoA epimerase